MSDKQEKIIKAAIELERALDWYLFNRAKGSFTATQIEDTKEAKEKLEIARKYFRKLAGMKV